MPTATFSGQYCHQIQSMQVEKAMPQLHITVPQLQAKDLVVARYLHIESAFAVYKKDTQEALLPPECLAAAATLPPSKRQCTRDHFSEVQQGLSQV